MSASTISSVTLTPKGQLLTTGLEPDQVSQKRRRHAEISTQNHYNYRSEMNSFRGPAGIAALFASGVGFYTAVKERSAAAIAHLGLGVAELGNVVTAGTNIFGNAASSNREEAHIATARRESATAWFQILAGVGGFGGLALETMSGSDHSEPSNNQKVSMSALMGVGAALMGVAGAEKGTLASISGGTAINETQGMNLNAKSDFRTAASGLIMSAYVWCTQIKPVKLLADIALPFAALRSGVQHFVEHGISNVFNEEPAKELSPTAKSAAKWTLGIPTTTSEEKTHSLPLLFGSNWYLNNVRPKLVMPIMKNVLGCEHAPDVTLKYSGGETSVLVEAKLNRSIVSQAHHYDHHDEPVAEEKATPALLEVAAEETERPAKSKAAVADPGLAS